MRLIGRQTTSLYCLFIWETQTKLCVIVLIFHANQQASENVVLQKQGVNI